MIELNKIYNMDCLHGLKQIDNESIDLTITSPPYDDLRTYNNSLIWDEIVWKKVIEELHRITKQGGVVVWVVADKTKNGSETGTSFKQALYFKETGFNLHDTMIYEKVNPIPLTHNRYEQQFEYMFIFSKGKPKTFNPIMIKCKTSGAYTNRRKTGRVKEAAARNRDEITITKSEKQKGNIWSYITGSKKGETGNHPAPFPEALVKDHITSWSKKGDIVLDPFAGSGTTAKMSLLMDRNFVCFEKEKEYCDIITKRLCCIKQQMSFIEAIK